jgi:hypothetical protein
MKRIALLAALFVHASLPGAAENYPTHTLETERFVVEITPRCSEGEVTCQRVNYRGVSKKSGAELSLRGETMHTRCADGVSPCRFLGYRFRSGKTRYLVWDDGDGVNGTLEVQAPNGKAVLTERGTWK